MLLTLSTNAQTIKLGFESQRQVVKFNFDSLTIYTDTTSLFSIYELEGTKGLEAYHQRVKNLILRQFRDCKNDTVTFSGSFVPFNDSVDTKYKQDSWYVDWAIVHLTERGKEKMFDKHNNHVKAIVVKKIGSRKKGHIRKAYINKDTKEELFYQTIYHIIYEPSF